ncbi:DUF3696 domain-containing protein [Corallococcus caeni]|uniref:AAA family ATPase n=1 Tax=Corallococcus caeni TaxID=3082388 RepID=UPI0029561C0D|nr:DUF3696 domain-containing protein [Corallococcus sp. KH5-1]
MIRKIHLKQFKCFQDREFSCGRLTLLTGFNGGGKSTVLQALVLLHQSLADGIESASARRTLALNGPLLSLGSARDVIDKVNGGQGFTIGLASPDTEIKWHLAATEASRDNLAVSIGSIDWKPLGTSDWITDSGGSFLPPSLLTTPANIDILRKIHTLKYIPADRVGPEQTYPLMEPQEHETLGPRAERAIGSMFVNTDLLVAQEMRHPSRLALEVFPRQVEAWLSDLFPGAVIDVQRVKNANLVTLGIRTNDATDFHRPHHVGFGMTFAIPVLVALLSAKKGDAVVIENPEAHLHPRAQARIGALCARAAAFGIQVLVETHSDHVLNGIRVAVHQGEIEDEDVTVLFFSPFEEESVQSLKIDRRGRIKHWPPGFFDENARLLDTLLEPIPRGIQE